MLHFYTPWKHQKALRSNGLVVKELDPNPGVSCSKPLGGFKVNLTFHPFKVDKMSTRDF